MVVLGWNQVFNCPIRSDSGAVLQELGQSSHDLVYPPIYLVTIYGNKFAYCKLDFMPVMSYIYTSTSPKGCRHTGALIAAT